MVNRDALWKGMIEDCPQEFLRLLFPDFIPSMNLDRDVVFLDKELATIQPDSDSKNRRADKLFKVWTKEGDEQWFLVHVEVQSYPDPDFAKRMFQYYYRILDKFDKPVAAIALYTDSNRAFHPKEYRNSWFNLELVYRFNTFVLLDHTPEQLRSHNNAFGFALEVARRAMDPALKNSDELLIGSKIEMLRYFLNSPVDNQTIRALLEFLKYYQPLQLDDSIRIFEQQLDSIIQPHQTMGIREAILKDVEEQGIQQGIEQGIQQGIEQGIQQGIEQGVLKGNTEAKFAIVIRAFNNGMDRNDIALLVDLPLEAVDEVIKTCRM